MNLLVILMGFVVGFLVGLTGIGGGVLMTPFLIIGLGIPLSLAIGTDLAYAAVTKTVESGNTGGNPPSTGRWWRGW